MTLKKRKTELWQHLLVIACFIIYERGFNYLLTRKWHFITFLFYLVEIPAFYIGSYYIMPLWVKDTKKILKSILSLAVMTFLFVLLQYGIGIVSIWHETGDLDVDLTWHGILRTLSRQVYLLGLAFAFYIGRFGVYKERSAKEILARNYSVFSKVMAMENNLLRSQVPPHLIFNSMDFIYSEIEEISPEGAESVEILSRIMKYSLSSADKDGLVPLHAELEQVENYVKLVKQRKKRTSFIDVDIDISGAAPGLVMPPVILVTMIENILKHGRLDNSNQPAFFQVTCKDRLLTVNSYNLISEHPAQTGHGIGLKNTLKRLERQFPGRYGLETSRSETTFQLKFYMDL